MKKQRLMHSRVDELRGYKGNHGVLLKDLPDDEVMLALPSYARREQQQFPKWKIRFIRPEPRTL